MVKKKQKNPPQSRETSPEDVETNNRRQDRTRESLALSEMIVETVREALVVLDERFRVLAANRSFFRIFRVAWSRVEGSSLFEVGEARLDTAQLREILKAVLDDDEVVDHELEFDIPEVGPRVMILNVRRMRSPLPDRAMILLAIHDITDRRRTEQRLLQSERLAAIGETMAGLAHESRNALQRAQAGLERLERRFRSESEGTTIIHQVQKALDDLHHLYESVRQYAAPIRLKKASCDLAEIVEDAWGDLASLRAGRKCALAQESGGMDLTCSIDRSHFQQVIRNILENSLAACEDAPGRTLEIRVRYSEADTQDGHGISMALMDNGPGLTPEARREVFNAFFTTKTRGTGLGLAIAKRILDAHNGDIRLGAGEELGAEFVITLPRGMP